MKWSSTVSNTTVTNRAASLQSYSQCSSLVWESVHDKDFVV